MKRDFSEQSRQRLLGLVNQVESEKFSNFTDWVGDRWYDFETWIGKLNIKNYLDDVNSYHKKVIDKNNATEEQINKIFENVHAVDSNYESNLQGKLDQARTIKYQITTFAETIRPGANKFNASGMDSLARISEEFEATCADFATKSEEELQKLIEEETTDPIKWFLTVIKTYLKFDESNENAGVTKAGISYMESLYKFFHNGFNKSPLTGAEELFDLFDNSVGLWTGFYDYLKTKYNEVGEIFSKENQKYVKGMDIVSSVAAYISSLFGAIDTIQTSEDMGDVGKVGVIFGTNKNAVSLWEAILKLIYSGDKTPNITTKSGCYSPLSFYAAILKGYISAISQGFASVDEYSADGEWSVMDTASTGIEASVAGLYAMLSSLTFGIISENFTGVSAKDVSDFLKNRAGNIGVEAGEYIKANPALYQAYQDGNVVVRIFLTFYAVAENSRKFRGPELYKVNKNRYEISDSTLIYEGIPGQEM